MKVEIPVGELKKALAGLSKVTTRTASLPVLRCVKVKCDRQEGVVIEGTNLNEWASVEMPASSTEPGEALVDLDELNKLVRTCSSPQSITISATDKQTVLRYPIGSSFADKSVGFVEVKEWPQMPASKWDASLKVGNDLKLALRQAFDCCSHDSSRYLLQGACLDVTDSKAHYVVGTDGRVLFSANSFSFDLKESIIIPNRKFLQWNGFVEDGDWSLSASSQKANGNGWVKLKSGRWTFVSMLVDGNYPNWRQVIPKGAVPTTISFNQDAVIFLIGAVPKLPLDPKDQHQTVHLVADQGNVLIQAKGGPNEQFTTLPIIGATFTGAPVTVAMNRDFLLRAMRFGLTDLELRGQDHALFKSAGKRIVVALCHRDLPPAPSATAKTSPVQATTSVPVTEPETKPIEERIQMTEAANPVEQNAPAKENTQANSFDQLKEQIKSIKDSLKSVVVQLDEVLKSVVQAHKEKKLSDKEIESARESLQQIQKIKI